MDNNNSKQENSDNDSFNQNRNSIFSFLQRSEVRLSTMHRIAGNFLSGAGLLLLFTVFSGKMFSDFFNNSFQSIKYLWELPTLSTTNTINFSHEYIIFQVIILAFPFILSLLIPIGAIVYLFKDIVKFYFIGHHFETTPDGIAHLFPRFILSGLSLPDFPEDKEQRKRIIANLLSKYIEFIIPPHEPDFIGKEIPDSIIPPELQLETMEKEGIIKLEDGGYYIYKDGIRQGGITKLKIIKFGKAYGLAGAHNRNLETETSKMTASLTRHNIYLRRLVLRYAKSLMISLWTFILSSFIVGIISINNVNIQRNYFIILAIGYIVWSSLNFKFVRFAWGWILEISQKGEGVEKFKDSQIKKFENNVDKFSWIALIASIVSLIASILQLYHSY